MSQGQTALHSVELGKRFGHRRLFNSLNFRLDAGETMAVTGANGSGKSTLLRILAGVLTPSAGRAELHVNGEPLDAEQHPLHVGFVAPYLNVYDGFTPRENLRFLARTRGLAHAELRVEETLDYVTLLDRADDPVNTFSSGMKQRVKFAAAVLAEPPLLLLDEPSVNLDAAGLEMVGRVVTDQRRRQGLLVVATNIAQEAEGYDQEIRIETFA